ncbi:hypothetical protein D3C79_909850 [compost metagenome]
MGNLLPAPLWVLEDRHVGAALLQITKAPLNGGGHQDKVVALLGAVKGVDQLWQQTRIGPLFGANGVRREMRGTNLHFDRVASPAWYRQPEAGQQQQSGQGLWAGR